MDSHENEWNPEEHAESVDAALNHHDEMQNEAQDHAAKSHCSSTAETANPHRYGHDETMHEGWHGSTTAMADSCCSCTTCDDRCLCMEVLPWCGFLGISYGAAWISSLFVRNAETLSFFGDRAWWMPPGWLFGAVWTVLYFLLGTAVWLAWRQHGCQRASSVCVLFITLLILQMGWTFAFFTLQTPFGALIDLIWTLAVTILLAMSIAPLNKLGALMLVPQVIWLIYALGLNYAYLE